MKAKGKILKGIEITRGSLSDAAHDPILLGKGKERRQRLSKQRME
ncbi:hypothetical protein SAMN04515647_2579 [Cohaesibacter sp. ES.047]|nr:hypothetical protein SAMN04515647_2579 [Cohaesibacter sp. ES.047]